MENIRSLPIHRSLIRPILLAGGERKLVMINYTIIVALLCGAGLNALTIITAFLLATIGHVCLVKLATYDSHFTHIYSRYRMHQDWYPAQCNIWNKNHSVKPAIAKGVRL